MKTKNKLLVILLTITLLSFSFPNNEVFGAESLTVDNFSISSNQEGTIVKDNSTGEQVSLKFTNDAKTEGVWTDIDGTTKKYTKDNNGSIYLDGVLVIQASQVKVPETSLNTDSFSANAQYNYNWKFVTTYTTTKSLQDTAQNITLGILSFFPYIGPFATIYGIIKTIKDSGKSEIYIKINQYISGDKKFIKNNSYYYSDPGYSVLLSKNLGGAMPSGF